MNRREFLLASGALGASLLAAEPIPVRVTLDFARRLVMIPADFTGLGYEISSVAAGVLSAHNAEYVAAVRRLGASGVIRIGGNTADDAFFRATGQPVSAPGDTVVNEQNLRELGGFLSATRWKLIWGLNLGSGSVAEAVTEAKAVAAAAKDSLLAFEIGNEPDLFGRGTRHRGSGYGYADYLREYRTYKAPIRRELPDARFAGPDAASATSWVTRFARDEGRDLALLTHHYYRECANPASTIEKLLNPDPKLGPELETLSAAARAAHVPYRICEANSLCRGGKPGVSDTLGAALWVLDYMFTVAAAGGAGVNVETGMNQLGFMSWYSPITTDSRGQVTTRPVYSGMLAFAPSLGGNRVASTCDGGAPFFKCYAVAQGADGAAITLINKDAARQVSVSIAAQPRLAARSLLRLSGPALASKDGVTLRDDNAGIALQSLVVPAGSAAVLTCALA